jgi:predicted CXXCH cytochrome family protein
MHKRSLPILLVVAALSVIGLFYARRSVHQRETPSARGTDAASPVAAPGGYADPAVCGTCHDQIATTFGRTGMGRSFSRLRADNAWRGGIYHEASDRHYTMVERDGRLYQRRHQIGFDGKESNATEFEAAYVVGSGNHARTFLSRARDGRLFQLPVSWYAENGGYWAMSPGYDRSSHLDFRRPIDAGCMSCHTGYPRTPVEDDGLGPRFGDTLPDGIDCQRCHGPGQAHVDGIKSGALDAALRAIVNPAKLDRERQLETCMQCHLEPTSTPLPFQIRRYEHAPFSYSPGKPLGDFFIYFDHAAGSGRDDKFEIASGAYRLRKSACFQRTEMTCVTCHDPHDIPRGAAAVERQVRICQGCHNGVHAGGVPRVAGVNAGATCLDCHMPKRRTEDAVHVVMTDHYIQRRRAARNLLADLKEADTIGRGDYKGEVKLYYPQTLPSTPENDLYLAVAQVQQGSNLTAGIGRLERAIETHRPQRPDFYYELARAYAKTSNHEAAIRWAQEALQRDTSFAPALKELATAATALGRLDEAARALTTVVAMRPKDSEAFADLGNIDLQQGRMNDARRALEQALALDPDLPRANNTMGLIALNGGDSTVAERHFREAIRHQPDLAEAQNNLGNLLANRRAYAEAAFHFEKAIRSNPNYAEARHSYGLVLALSGASARAVVELRAAARLMPRSAQIHLDLGDALAMAGRPSEAVHEYELALQISSDPEIRRIAEAALRSLPSRGH